MSAAHPSCSRRSARGCRGADVYPPFRPIAVANLARHGLDGSGLLHVADTRTLPFADASFDLALANSVLEYVDPAHFDALFAELHRIVKPGGQLLVCGTASRLAPREPHSGRLFVNYLPRFADRIVGRRLQRGLDPRRLARAVRGRFDPVRTGDWEAARRAVHGRLSPGARLAARAGRVIGIAPGWLAPYIEILFVRR